MIKLLEILGEIDLTDKQKKQLSFYAEKENDIFYFSIASFRPPNSKQGSSEDFYRWGRIVASCRGQEIDNTIHLTEVQTKEDSRNKGYGTYLFRKILDWCKKNGIKKITLDVITDNNGAVSLYKKLGFQIVDQVFDSSYSENDHYKMIKLLEIVNKAGLNIDYKNAMQREMKYIGPGNDYLQYGHLFNVIILGKYTTLVPHGGQSEVPLFPSSEFTDSDFGDQPNFDENEVKNNIGHIESLIKQGQYKVIK